MLTTRLVRARRSLVRAFTVSALLAACGGTAPVPGTPGASSISPSISPSPGTSSRSAETSPGSTETSSGSTGTSSAPPATAANPAGLTDAEMVGQLFMTYVYGRGADLVTPAQRRANLALYGEPTPARVVRRWHLGGVILLDHNPLDPARPSLSTQNLTTAAQLRALTDGLQAVSRADTGQPLLVAADQEGGRVQRLAFLPAQPSQRSMSGWTTDRIRCSYAALGRRLLAVGVNQDFAPVADVTGRRTGVIGDRSFGPDPRRDAALVTAAVEGLHSAGVLATLKHWPGHGSTSTDSHRALAVIPRSAAAWRTTDLPPFAVASRLGAAVMVGHLAFPAVDPSGAPATLSPVLVDRLLRDGSGFDGLVVTDSLWMQPARAAGRPGDVALGALAAGNDVLLMPPDLPAAHATVLRAVRSSPLVRAQAQDAARRVIAAKHRPPQPSPHPCP